MQHCSGTVRKYLLTLRMDVQDDTAIQRAIPFVCPEIRYSWDVSFWPGNFVSFLWKLRHGVEWRVRENWVYSGFSHQEIQMWPGCGFRQVKCKVHLDLREQMKLMSAGYLHRSGEGRKDAVNRIRTKKKKDKIFRCCEFRQENLHWLQTELKKVEKKQKKKKKVGWRDTEPGKSQDMRDKIWWTREERWCDEENRKANGSRSYHSEWKSPFFKQETDLKHCH